MDSGRHGVDRGLARHGDDPQGFSLACPRCTGQLVRDWDAISCLQCGHIVAMQFTEREIERARLEFLLEAGLTG